MAGRCWSPENVVARWRSGGVGAGSAHVRQRDECARGSGGGGEYADVGNLGDMELLGVVSQVQEFPGAARGRDDWGEKKR